jgi:hypothetical protein
MILWVGLAASSTQLLDLFGEEDVHSLSPSMVPMPPKCRSPH